MKKIKPEHITINPAMPAAEDEIDLYELWMTLWGRRKFIVVFSAAAVIATIIISLLMANIYRAQATILPVAASSGGMLGDLAGMAALAGISMGSGGDNSTKIMIVAESRTVKELVVLEFSLEKVIVDSIPSKRDPLQYTLEAFDKLISITADKKTGLITIAFDWEDPVLAAKIVNRYVAILQETLETKALDVNKMKRIFLEKRLNQEREKFSLYKRELARFQKRTKIFEPAEQAKGTMNIYGTLLSQKIALEVQMQGLESALSADNPRLTALKEQISAINKRLKSIESGSSEGAFMSMESAPGKMVEYTDIMEKLKISQGVYETLAKLYEKAKLDEANNEIYAELIDGAIPPDKKFKPKRALMVIVSAFASGFLAVFYVFFTEWLRTIKEERG